MFSLGFLERHVVEHVSPLGSAKGLWRAQAGIISVKMMGKWWENDISLVLSITYFFPIFLTNVSPWDIPVALRHIHTTSIFFCIFIPIMVTFAFLNGYMIVSCLKESVFFEFLMLIDTWGCEVAHEWDHGHKPPWVGRCSPQNAVENSLRKQFTGTLPSKPEQGGSGL